jgi:hypothetical protein
MNAEAVTLDVGECVGFLQFWMEVTDTPHVTLVSIVPDGKTSTRTFGRGDLDEAKAWIVGQQEAWSNVYFQPNETPAGCSSKPSKTMMVAAHCRFGDVDPLDDQFLLAEERDRLMRLGAHLASDPVFPTTAVIDSGNGVQPIWAVSRELLSPWATNRVEAETQAIEEALGAGGTHNIDRLLRLPGTVNYPNAKKRQLGRGVTRARLIHSAPNLYGTAQAAQLAAHLREHLAGTDLIRPKLRPASPGAAHDADGAEVGALIEQLLAAGAAQVSRLEHLPEDLVRRLMAAIGGIAGRAQLARRWAGEVDDLKQSGLDSSRSGMDMSLAAMLKAAGFNHLEAGLLLCAFPHGKANNDQWSDERSRLRHVARCVVRSHEPPSAGDVVPADSLLVEFNQRYLVVNEAGKALVYEPVYDSLLKRRTYTHITFQDLGRLYRNRRVVVGKDDKGKMITMSVADIWLNHPSRRQYIGGITFDPSGEPTREDVLNLWQGFAVEPWPETWALLRGHILDVICSGNQEHFDFLVGWMARLVQNPAQQGEVAVVMRGTEGAGKGIVARALLRIFGQHAFAIAHGSQLTGHFNAHLRDCVFLFADEAFFPGDRSHVGALKSLITEPYLAIEGKYQNAVLVPNFVHLMMASNEDWVVPASLADRRFLVLDVSPEHANDHAYFAAILGELDRGGYEAMLYDLLHYDLSNYNPRKVPATAGLQAQKKLSLPTEVDWWKEVLFRGYLYESRLGLEDIFGVWEQYAATELLFQSYLDHAKHRRERRPVSREDLGKFMRKMKATPTKRDMLVGEHMADIPNGFGGTSRKAEVIRRHKNGYHLGALADARAEFEGVTGLKVDWPEDG